MEIWESNRRLGVIELSEQNVELARPASRWVRVRALKIAMDRLALCKLNRESPTEFSKAVQFKCVLQAPGEGRFRPRKNAQLGGVDRPGGSLALFRLLRD